MFSKTPYKDALRSLDLPLLLAVGAAYALGVFAIYSAAGGAGGMGRYFALRQLAWGGISACAFLLVLTLDADYLLQKAYAIYALSCVLLLLLFILGHRAKGAQSWISLGIMQIQPIEFAKISLALLLAHHLKNHPPRGLRHVACALALCGVSVLLVLLQPDLGGVLVFLAMIGVALIVAGTPKKILAGLLFLALASLPIGWTFLKDYQKKRVLVFINPELDPLGAGYNVIQSRIAVGSGGFLGKGFMQGTQSKLRFLPEPHTDFIFSVIAEELGLLGCLLLLLLYTFIMVRILTCALSLRSVEKKILIAAISAWLWFHILESISMSMGLLPVTGLPLPFVSYGGSALLALTLAIAIVQKSAESERLALAQNPPPDASPRLRLQRLSHRA